MKRYEKYEKDIKFVKRYEKAKKVMKRYENRIKRNEKAI